MAKMETVQEYKTNYPGAFYIIGSQITDGKPEKNYYIRYRVGGKAFKEPVGRQYQNGMTAHKGVTPSDETDSRATVAKQKSDAIGGSPFACGTNKWTVSRFWEEYKASKPDIKGIMTNENRFQNYRADVRG